MIEKARLSIIVFAISITCHVIAIVQFFFQYKTFDLSYDVLPQFLIFISLSFAAAIAMFLLNNFIAFRLLLLFRLFLIIAATFPFKNYMSIELYLITALITETSVYESFPRNLIFSIICIIVCIYIKYPFLSWGKELPASDIHGIFCFGLYSAVLAIMSSLMNHYREKVVEQEEHIGRLGTATARLTKANTEFQQYASAAWEQSALDERKRLSRQIHDVIGYTFTNLIMMMEAATDLAVKNPVKVTKLIEQARVLAQEGLDDIRSELHSLRSIGIKREVGIKAIYRIIQIFKDATMVSVDVHYANIPMNLGDKIDTAMYHFVQEGMTNAFKHGKATQIDVFFREENSKINIIIRDNGIGTEKIEEGLGISGMRERLEALGGRFEVRNASTGFEISAWLPLE